ncbi:MAG: tRNA (adenosine(37)-N6)-dimethylallyltransferase MiaA, partial [Duodenibacillus sp.]|nr:tRNA (adenosine(37)-N6)-dimethylallyltransferase MiaA [Duodenibacillus sp.]
VYRGMDIGTAKPDAAERAVCPHHLIDIRGIAESYSAADFAQQAAELVEAAAARGRLPVIAGGTMLYAKALREGMDGLPPTDPAVRAEVQRQADGLGWPAMHALLAQADPATAARLAPSDSQRIARALEVLRMTGRAISSFQTGARAPDPAFRAIGLMPADRAALHAAIGRRFDLMLGRGFLDEVRALAARPDFSPELPSMRAVGYRQALEHLAGETGLEAFADKAKAATRQLAKRQMTWLRGMQGVELAEPAQAWGPLRAAALAILEAPYLP